MSGKRMSEIITRFIRDAGTDNPEFYSDWHLEGIYQGRLNGNDTIFSYGTHFPLAEIIPDATLRMGNRARTARPNPARGWWLLNGDRWAGSGGWGASTSSQQADVQAETRATGLPVLIVPFSALSRAGIRHNSITVVDSLPDRYTWEQRTRDNAPSAYELESAPGDGEVVNSTWHFRNWQQLEDGRWSYEQPEHHLGEALFTADWDAWSQVDGHTVAGTSYFLSAFDENEPGFGLYFLAQLPVGREPHTIWEARQALKPVAVLRAEWEGREVLRQGDVFAIARPEVLTRAIPGPSEHRAYVLNVNHQVTEVRHDKGMTLGRGVMRHKPREWGRQPEHRAVKLGDGRAWYQLVKNTVPEGRSWSVGGKVD